MKNKKRLFRQQAGFDYNLKKGFGLSYNTGQETKSVPNFAVKADSSPSDTQYPEEIIKKREFSLKHRRNLSLAHKGQKPNSGSFKKGQKFSQEIRNKMSLARKKEFAEKNHNWKGGKKKQLGYILRYKGIKFYIQEHRLVMEKYLGRKLNSNELVHHINGNKEDNRIENLQLLSSKEHSSFHHPKGFQVGISSKYKLTNEYPEEIIKCLSEYFPKGDKRRGEALVLQAVAYLEGKKAGYELKQENKSKEENTICKCGHSGDYHSDMGCWAKDDDIMCKCMEFISQDNSEVKDNSIKQLLDKDYSQSGR